MRNFSKLLFAFLALLCCLTIQAQPEVVHESETLIIKKISDHAFIHISFLETEDFGKVPCNGMILIDNAEAFILETPTDDKVSGELIRWVSTELECKITGVIAHHFHIDCLGGLQAFHDQGIPSYANEQTISLAIRHGYIPPQNAMKTSFEFKVGDLLLVSSYFGPAHTVDNMVSYFPEEEILFGGCMIKSLKAGKGNLADADIEQWPLTVRKIKDAYPNLQRVVPGHGLGGGTELLSYTIDLFED